MSNKIQYLVVDTTAFIKNAPLQEIGENIITHQDVVNEITNKRQLRRLVVLPYDFAVKDVFPENINFITEFAKKTGDYRSLSATDIKIMALTYQLEKEHVGVDHLKTEPEHTKQINLITNKSSSGVRQENIAGFYKPKNDVDDVAEEVDNLEINETTERQVEIEIHENETSVEDATLLEDFSNANEILKRLEDDGDSEDYEDVSDENDDEWITPSNIKEKKQQINADFEDDAPAVVACLTTDFAMQNVLKQIGLHVATLDGKVIRQLRTFIFRCYTCFKTTSIMTKVFCPNCGNQTLKKVSVSLDKNGKQIIHINTRRPLTARGKKFSLPTPQGGKHANNPILFEDQPIPDQRPSRLARTKNNPLDPDYIAGYSPFVMRDITSKSAMLGIQKGHEVKHWMRKNPNEVRRKRK